MTIPPPRTPGRPAAEAHDSRRRLGWRGGIVFVVLCLLVGTLVGVLVDKAQGRPAELRSPTCGVEVSCTSRVSTARQGVRKFKRERLGRAHRLRYTAKQRRIITRALVRAQHRLARERPDARLAAAGRRALWRSFTAHDDCFFKVSGSAPSTATWTCDGRTADFPDDADWTGDDVDAVICSGVAAIGIGGALAAGLTGPWTWAGIGAGWALCVWQDNLHDRADKP